MVAFIRKYSFIIILALVIGTLVFWFNPSQKKLYLESDYESIEEQSSSALLVIMGIGALAYLIFAIIRVRKMAKLANVFVNIVVLTFTVYFLFNTVFLSCFLALNRIEVSRHFEKKYTVSFYQEEKRRVPLIYDFRKRKTLLSDRVGRIDKLKSTKFGDTIIISFRKDLLGVPFSPEVK